MTNEEAYQYALKLEDVRECHWRATPQGAFESEMEAWDNIPNPPQVSDGGAGVRRMVQGIDTAERDAKHNGVPSRRLNMVNAAMTISRNAPECLPTFWAVVRNGTNRKESVWQLMKVWAETPPPKRKVKKHKKGGKKGGGKGGKNRHPRKRRGKRPSTATVHTLKKC